MQWEFSKKYFTKDMDKFIEKAYTPSTGEINQSRVISELYFIGKLEEIAFKMIESNGKHAMAMRCLTFSLVFVGFAQLIIAIIEFF